MPECTPRFLADFNRSPMLNRDPGSVLPTVFKSMQAFQQQFRHRPIAHIFDDTTHDIILSCEYTSVFDAAGRGRQRDRILSWNFNCPAKRTRRSCGSFNPSLAKRLIVVASYQRPVPKHPDSTVSRMIYFSESIQTCRK